MAVEATTVLAVVSVVAAVAGGAVAAYSAVEQGKAADEAAQFNADMAERDAQIRLDQAAYEARQVERRNRLMAGKQQAAAGKSGTFGGSFQDIVYDSLVQGELDRMAALYTGAVVADSRVAEAGLSRWEGANARHFSYFRAGSSLLAGAGQGARSWSDYRRDSADPTF